MRVFGWIFAGIALILAVYFGVRAERAQRRAESAERIIESQQRMAAYAKDFRSAVFVRATTSTITYRLPRQTQVGSSTYINYLEQTASYGTELSVFGPLVGERNSQEVFADLQEGHPISIKFVGGTEATSSPRIEAVYVAP
jgi:hypothetical protein